MDFASTILTVLLTALCAAADPNPQYQLTVLPPEHKTITDPATGAELLFLTTGPAKDLGLYFYQQSRLADESVILFTSDRKDGGLMGYITKTGELIRITTPQGGLAHGVASMKRPTFYARRGDQVLELTLATVPSENLERKPSSAVLTERLIGVVSKAAHTTFLSENSDATRLAFGMGSPEGGPGAAIVTMDIASGELKEICRLPDPPGYGGHVQWSRTNPNLISFAGRPQRLMVVDVRDGVPRNVYKAGPEELVTHESWWVNDQMLFCGGTHLQPSAEAHLKVLDPATGVMRIIGPGAWWPGGTESDIAKVNWWHASGSYDGRWAAADNWHGDIMLFEAKTTRPRLLTTGHRTYGHGEHPHVGWDRVGKAVVFTSERFGNPDVCVATIPDAFQASNP